MKRSEAARYARWSATLALLLALVTLGVYVQHKAVARVQKRGAPPAAPVNVERQSNGLTFSKVDGDRKIFTVEASKSTEFRNQEASLLEEVKITIFGQQGDRHDVIRTHSCQYSKGNGAINCSGAVQIELETAAEAELAKKRGAKESAGPMGHVETRNVTFDQSSGTAHTSERVTFKFPEGSGEAMGVEYNSQLGTMKLLRDVKMTLIQSRGPRGTAGQEVHVMGTSLDFDRDTKLLHLEGPAHAQTQSAQLDAGEMTLNLDEDFRARRFLATAGGHGKRPHAVSSAASGPMDLTANVLTAWFDQDGDLRRLDASGKVEGSRKTGAEEEEFTAANSSVELWPEVSQPKLINMDGGVILKTSATTGQIRILETNKARMEFTEGSDERPSQPKRAETLTPGTIQWTDAQETGQVGDSLDAAKNKATRTKLSGDKFVLDFTGGKATQLAANGNVQVQRDLAGAPSQITTAKHGVAHLLANGGWSQFELNENVKFKEGERSGQADRAVAARASQITTLTGQAIVRDASTETRAANIVFMQASGDIRAEGGVRSRTFAARGPASPVLGTPPQPSAAMPQVASGPANITAEKMLANSKSGRALYSGHARLWQGDSVLEADSIELLQKTRQLNAVGKVRSVFPQAAGHDVPGSPVTNKSSKKPSLWHIASDALTYLDLENRAHLEGNVVVQSDAQRMRSDLLDLYFTRANAAGAAQKSSNAASGANGAQQISRAVGSGGVVVDEQARKATAERAEYTAADGKFVMSGGNPTLFDGTQGTTTGRQLTFFLADDTIIVDSEKGSRTLTKHQVQK
ncbi:MAG: lipopolysaccharide export system protein LptA [Acidobacteriaceae bacterium]|jgi:lipopolysaccharide export system protein LptA|nr:lipopolysaccharide export system protein LptA [Acidobacteriaceae bacterium]